MTPLWRVGELDGARGLGPVRHPLRRPSRSAPHPPLRGVRGSSAAQGLPEGEAPAAGRPEELDADRSGAPRSASVRATDAGRGRPRATISTPSRSSSSMGPSHPATHGTVQVHARARRRDTSSTRQVEVGYLHRGFEKECESGELVPGDPVHRPPELRLADAHQRRLLPGRGEALRHRACRALPVAARDRGRALAHRRPLHLHRRERASSSPR